MRSAEVYQATVHGEGVKPLRHAAQYPCAKMEVASKGEHTTRKLHDPVVATSSSARGRTERFRRVLDNGGLVHVDRREGGDSNLVSELVGRRVGERGGEEHDTGRLPRRARSASGHRTSGKEAVGSLRSALSNRREEEGRVGMGRGGDPSSDGVRTRTCHDRPACEKTSHQMYGVKNSSGASSCS